MTNIVHNLWLISQPQDSEARFENDEIVTAE
jgi:hypothetical protein